LPDSIIVESASGVSTGLFEGSSIAGPSDADNVTSFQAFSTGFALSASFGFSANGSFNCSLELTLSAVFQNSIDLAESLPLRVSAARAGGTELAPSENDAMSVNLSASTDFDESDESEASGSEARSTGHQLTAAFSESSCSDFFSVIAASDSTECDTSPSSPGTSDGSELPSLALSQEVALPTEDPVHSAAATASSSSAGADDSDKGWGAGPWIGIGVAILFAVIGIVILAVLVRRRDAEWTESYDDGVQTEMPSTNSGSFLTTAPMADHEFENPVTLASAELFHESASDLGGDGLLV
jgi:hypothetical protein